MTEPATPKPFFTRRRVIAGAVGAIVIVVVAGLRFGVLNPNASGLLTVRVDGFKTDRLGRTSALITVSNTSRRTDFHIYTGTFSDGRPGKSSGTFTNILSWYPSGPTRMADYLHQNPGQDTKATVDLPADGRTGRVAVAYVMPNTSLPPLIKRVETLWRRWWPRPAKTNWVADEQVILCPRKLPDGTVEPPRILSAPGAKLYPK